MPGKPAGQFFGEPTVPSSQNSLIKPRLAGVLFVLAMASVVFAPQVSQAQDYPSKPLTIVVPYPPGSASDLLARLFQTKLGAVFKEGVIVENRAGASTNIGTDYVAHAAPNGYTVLLQAPNIATNQFAFVSLRWKLEDFAPIGQLVRYSNVLVAGPSAPSSDLRQLIASGNTATLNYGSPGTGSLSNLGVEMLKGKTGLGVQHITYPGPAPMINGLLGGHIQYGATNPANFMAYVKDPAKKLKPLAVLGSQRDSTIPDVPNLADFGISGIEAYGWFGLLAPAKTPPAIVQRLHAEFMKVLAMPEVSAKLRSEYLEPFGTSPEEFGRFIAAENRKWGDAFRAAGIKPE